MKERDIIKLKKVVGDTLNEQIAGKIDTIKQDCRECYYEVKEEQENASTEYGKLFKEVKIEIKDLNTEMDIQRVKYEEQFLYLNKNVRTLFIVSFLYSCILTMIYFHLNYTEH
tara:strand:- start:9528 stop:9866 length:339 start_codon:yes stop_codon:yes gene_type:complete